MKEEIKIDHSEHGIGDDSGPYDSDCICRETEKELECANAGCGFCKASIQTQ